jgi:hypothetical protein
LLTAICSIRHGTGMGCRRRRATGCRWFVVVELAWWVSPLELFLLGADTADHLGDEVVIGGFVSTVGVG